MNNLAYSTQQPEKVAGYVEEKLRKETGATAPIPFTVEQMDAGKTSAKTVLKDMGSMLFGGNTNILFKIVFDITMPRVAQMQAFATRHGIGCIVNSVVFSTVIHKPIAGEVSLDANKNIFNGDQATAAKLTAKGDLFKRIIKLARTRGDIGGITFTQPRYVELMPLESGCLFALGTIPRQTGMGFDASLDAKEFFDIVAMVEAAL
jgi:hypothetical protein